MTNGFNAGYNPPNEPTDSKHTRLVVFYDRVYDAIRAIDANHPIYLFLMATLLHPTFFFLLHLRSMFQALSSVDD